MSHYVSDLNNKKKCARLGPYFYFLPQYRTIPEHNGLKEIREICREKRSENKSFFKKNTFNIMINFLLKIVIMK